MTSLRALSIVEIMTDLEYVRLNLSTAMEHCGLKLETLAARASVEPAYLRHLLLGHLTPSAAECEVLAGALKISSDDLVRRPSQFRRRLKSGTLGLEAAHQSPEVGEVGSGEGSGAAQQRYNAGNDPCWPLGSLSHPERIERRRAIAECVASGRLTLGQAAKEFGVSPSFARKICKEHGVELPMPRPRAERALRRREIAQWIANGGCTLEQAAKEFGASIGYVRTACKEHGVAFCDLNSHAHRALRRREIAQWVVAHSATMKEAASEFGVSTTTVSAACRELGVPPKRPPQVKGSSQMKALALLIEGYSQTDAAERLGVSRQFVADCALKARSSGVFAAVDKAVEFAMRNRGKMLRRGRGCE